MIHPPQWEEIVYPFVLKVVSVASALHQIHVAVILVMLDPIVPYSVNVMDTLIVLVLTNSISVWNVKIIPKGQHAIGNLLNRNYIYFFFVHTIHSKNNHNWF